MVLARYNNSDQCTDYNYSYLDTNCYYKHPKKVLKNGRNKLKDSRSKDGKSKDTKEKGKDSDKGKSSNRGRSKNNKQVLATIKDKSDNGADILEELEGYSGLVVSLVIFLVDLICTTALLFKVTRNYIVLL